MKWPFSSCFPGLFFISIDPSKGTTTAPNLSLQPVPPHVAFCVFKEKEMWVFLSSVNRVLSLGPVDNCICPIMQQPPRQLPVTKLFTQRPHLSDSDHSLRLFLCAGIGSLSSPQSSI